MTQDNQIIEMQISEIGADLKKVLRILNGNGTPGLVAHVAMNQNEINYIKATCARRREEEEKRDAERRNTAVSLISPFLPYVFMMIGLGVVYYLGGN